jgi:prevent-host-death family protein
MKTVTITEAEAGIARLIRLVRKGETVVIVSRGKPVAEIRPAPVSRDDRVASATGTEKARSPRGKQDWSWLKAARERHPTSIGLSEAIIEEREEGM